MNIAFFLNRLCDNPLNHSIIECLNEAVQHEDIKDASLFFVNVGPVSKPVKFGMFNSTDVWNFSGNLISTSISGIGYLQNVANKTKIVYLFSHENNTLGLIHISRQIPILVTTEDEQKEVFRLTGITPRLISLTPKALLEFFDE